MFWHWFYHSFAGWLLRIQLIMLRSFFFFCIRIFYRLTRKTVSSIGAPFGKENTFSRAGAATACRMPDSRFGVCGGFWHDCP